MKRFIWRIRLAKAMLDAKWGWGSARYALRGGYDDSYYDDEPENPYEPRDVLSEEIAAGMS